MSGGVRAHRTRQEGPCLVLRILASRHVLRVPSYRRLRFPPRLFRRSYRAERQPTVRRFLAETNVQIEEAFSSSQDDVQFMLPSMDTPIKIAFKRGQSFALQKNEARGSERAVRRVIKTVQDIKAMLDRMATPPIDLVDLVSTLPEGTVPHHFLCPIFQEIMSDPVKTIDGFTYDRPAIERWFQSAHTSPLTNLPLTSLALEPNVSLRQKIEEFARQHAGT